MPEVHVLETSIATFIDGNISTVYAYRDWSYSTVRKYNKPYLRTFGRDPRDTLPYVQISFNWAM